MKRKPVRIFLIIVISFSIPLLFSAYFLYYNLAEADFLSSDLVIENPDQEHILLGEQNESKAFISSAFPIIFPQEIILFEQSHHFPSIICSRDEKTFILRC